MSKQQTKKILITIGLTLLIAVGVYLTVLCIISIVSSIDFLTNKIYEFYKDVEEVYFNTLYNLNVVSLMRTSLFCVFCCVSIIIYSYMIVLLWKHTIELVKKDFQYTYLDYKEKKEHRKQAKIEKKRTKLLNKIKKL